MNWIMISTKNASHLMVEQKPEIWVTDYITIKFKNKVSISDQGALNIIEQAADLLRLLEVNNKYE